MKMRKNRSSRRMKQMGKGCALLLGTVLCVTGCSSSSKSSNTTTAEYALEESYTGVAAGYDYEKGTMSDAQETTYDESTGKGNMPTISTASQYNRKVIKTGEMVLQTEDFNQTYTDLMTYLEALGGYVENSNIMGRALYEDRSTTRRGSLTVRIPNAQFDNFVNQGGTFGNVLSFSCNSEDITANYVDTEIRLKALKARHERLLVLLDQSGSLSQLFEIESEISNVTYEIDKLGGTLAKYDALVDMGTLTIELQEVKEIKPVEITNPTFVDRLAETFSDSMKAVGTMLQGIALLCTAMIPMLIVIVPIVAILWMLIKHFKKDKFKKDKYQMNRDEEDTKIEEENEPK